MRNLGLAAGIGLVAVALVPAFLHSGPCDSFGPELVAAGKLEPDAWLNTCCLFAHDFYASSELVPTAYLCGLIVLAFGIALRLSGPLHSAAIVAIAGIGTALASAFGFVSSGLSPLLAFTDDAFYGSAILVAATGFLMRAVDPRSPNKSLERTRDK